jgi:hypothetical protein
MSTKKKIKVAQIIIVILLFALGFVLGIATVCCDQDPSAPSIEDELISNETIPEDNEDEVLPEDNEDMFIGDVNIDIIANCLDLGVGEPTPGGIVNTVDGRAYADGTIVIYQFDVESSEYKFAVASGTILMYQTIYVDVSACNGGYVLIIYDDYMGNREELIEKFTSIKM